VSINLIRAQTYLEAADLLESMNEGCTHGPENCGACTAREDAADIFREKATAIAATPSPDFYDSMVCDHEGHMIPHSPCCSERTDTSPAHDYLSTGCLHGDLTLPDGRTGHEYCQGDTGHAGTKQPGQCKFCAAPCRCDCHTN
jgi:hypothetical protein